MKEFIHNDFMLTNDYARQLYHTYAEKMPIIDYHNHLSPQMIAQDYRFGSIAELWLGGDHYKWRALRANGVAEEYITGNSPDREKFRAWARTLPYTMRNPLYHWTQLELKRYFGIDDLLCEQNADEIYVLHEGRIVERGGHDELIAKNGYYKRLYDMQQL